MGLKKGCRTMDLSAHQWLFHGTIENLEGPIRVGGYDGVFWTAEHSTIAQCYIPASTGATYCAIANFRLREWVRPSKTDPFYILAKTIGPEAQDVQWDEYGRPVSWKIPDGYLRYGDVVDYIENVLGYRSSGSGGDKVYELITDGWHPNTNDPRIMPADYKKRGSLVILDGFQGMRIANLSTGESDLTDLQYHRVDLFRELESQGFDGVAIDDFAQSKTWGNVGHLSIGFFQHALNRLSATIIPATRFDWDKNVAPFKQKISPEFEAHLRSLETRPAVEAKPSSPNARRCAARSI